MEGGDAQTLSSHACAREACDNSRIASSSCASSVCHRRILVSFVVSSEPLEHASPMKPRLQHYSCTLVESCKPVAADMDTKDPGCCQGAPLVGCEVHKLVEQHFYGSEVFFVDSLSSTIFALDPGK